MPRFQRRGGRAAQPSDLWLYTNASKLADCLSCPLRGFLAHGLHLETPLNPYAAQGIALHGLFQQFFTRARGNKKYPYETLEALLGSWRFQWYGAVNGQFAYGRRGPSKKPSADPRRRIVEVVWTSPEQPHTLFRDGEKVLTKFHERFAPIRYDGTPRVVEQRFSVRWHGLRLTGYIDRIDFEQDGAVLLDYKPWGFQEYQRISDLQMTIYQLAYELGIRKRAPGRVPLKGLRVYQYKAGVLQEIPLRTPAEFGLLFAAIAEVAAYYESVLTSSTQLAAPPRTFELFRADDVERGDITPRLPRGRHCMYCAYVPQCRQWEAGELVRARDAYRQHWADRHASRAPTQTRLDLQQDLTVRFARNSVIHTLERRVAEQLGLDGIELRRVPAVVARPKYRSRKRL